MLDEENQPSIKYGVVHLNPPGGKTYNIDMNIRLRLRLG